MDYIVECNKDLETFWKEHFERLETVDITDLRIIAFHITATQDECAEIKESGLINLQKVLSKDTKLKELLASYDSTFDIPTRTITAMDRVINISYDHQSRSAVARRLYYDYLVNGFMSNDEVFN